MRWKSLKQIEITKTYFECHYMKKRPDTNFILNLLTDMMIKEKTIDKAEKKSDELSRKNYKKEYENNFDFEQYKNCEDELV